MTTFVMILVGLAVWASGCFILCKSFEYLKQVDEDLDKQE